MARLRRLTDGDESNSGTHWVYLAHHSLGKMVALFRGGMSGIVVRYRMPTYTPAVWNGAALALRPLQAKRIVGP